MSGNLTNYISFTTLLILLSFVLIVGKVVVYPLIPFESIKLLLVECAFAKDGQVFESLMFFENKKLIYKQVLKRKFRCKLTHIFLLSLFFSCGFCVFIMQ
jgi:hypothetical protein